MPRKSEWLHRVASAIEALQVFPAPVVDRATLEKLLGTGRRQTIRLMHQFGGYQAGRTFLIGRLELLHHLEAVERGEAHQVEMQRLHRLQTRLRRRKTITVAPEAWDRNLAELPPGIRFSPGILEIEFQNTEQLLSRLFELAQGIQNDFERFEATVSQFVPISPPSDGNTCT